MIVTQTVTVELESGPPGRSAFDLWLSKPENAGKTFADYEATQRGPVGPQGPPGDTSVAESIAGEAVTVAATARAMVTTESDRATAAESAIRKDLSAAMAGIPVISTADTDLSLTPMDAGKCREFTADEIIAVNLPNEDSGDFPDGAFIIFDQGGSGVIRLAEAGGVDLFPSDKRQSIGPYSTFAILRIARNQWRVIGELDPV
ncbi:hypothetical protein JIN85_20150 [Luteolibacter pohnpeiensis]|uniref:Uncharacterized protein n=2 Tax=Luteolibacter pohnpeiensis TaxID=454153 RepID=A0A934VXU1_9BACT|nr:hypothetical protein [Luteolibacter pohnpeiensis]